MIFTSYDITPIEAFFAFSTTLLIVKNRKLALQEAFEFVPAKFIDTMYKEHHHYYGAFFAILEAERGLSSARPPPFAPLKSRRVSTKSSAAIMAQLEQDGFDFENLKKEIDSAFQRRKKDECTFKSILPHTHVNLSGTFAFIQDVWDLLPFHPMISKVTPVLSLCLTRLFSQQTARRPETLSKQKTPKTRGFELWVK